MQELTILRPLRSSKISQGWGENKACTTDNGRIISARGGVCPNGTEPYYLLLNMKGHNGIDYPCIVGEAIVHGASFDGWMKTEVDMAGGKGVDVISDEPVFLPTEYVPASVKPELKRIEQNGRYGYAVHIKMRYWHLSTPLGWDGKKVKHGQIIGLGGNTGASSAPHLHFGMKICDKNGESLEPWNGYNGAQDPTPFLDNTIFAADSVEYLGLGAPQPTPEERKIMNNQLSIARKIFLALRELVYKL